MTAFRLVQGHWIGAEMKMTTYENVTPGLDDKHRAFLATSSAEYRLLDARPAPLDVEAFDLDTYLIKGASVFDNSTGNSSSFKYDPDDGTLKEQAEKARKKLSQAP